MTIHFTNGLAGSAIVFSKIGPMDRIMWPVFEQSKHNSVNSVILKNIPALKLTIFKTKNAVESWLMLVSPFALKAFGYCFQNVRKTVL
jgi:hypothetical protein